jgi:hypothetical protein
MASFSKIHAVDLCVLKFQSGSHASKSGWRSAACSARLRARVRPAGVRRAPRSARAGPAGRCCAVLLAAPRGRKEGGHWTSPRLRVVTDGHPCPGSQLPPGESGRRPSPARTPRLYTDPGSTQCRRRLGVACSLGPLVRGPRDNVPCGSASGAGSNLASRTRMSPKV